MKLIAWLKSFGKMRVITPQPRMQCVRCHEIASSARQRAEHAHYAPYCGFNCKEWGLLEEALRGEQT